MAEIWREETTRHRNGLTSFTGYTYNSRTGMLEEIKYQTPDLYIHYLLNREAEEWIMRVYELPNANDEDYLEDRRALFADLKEFGPSVGWAKDGKLTVVKFFDNGVARPWDPDKEDIAPDLKSIAIGMSLKTSKYMSMFSQATYYNGSFITIFLDEDDDRYYEHEEGVLFVRVTNLPEDEAYLQDGHFFVRPEVRNEMVRAAHERILPHDPEKARRVRRAGMKAKAFNGRMPTNIGTFKGDTLVSYALNCDVQIDQVNIKPDIRTRVMGEGLFQMFPQEQNGAVFTNRQSVANFYSSLMDVPTPGRDGHNLIKDALTDYIDGLIDQFRSGELMFHIDSLGRDEQDSIRNVFEKLEAWVESGMSLNESVYLLMMQAGQVMDMHTPPDSEQDKRRRFPIPFASRHSIRNAKTYEMVFGIKLDLEFGEFFVDPDYGIIMSDETYRVAAPIWGGADLDDHVELHYRVAEGDHSYFTHINDGDIVAVGIRNPIGVVSNGTDIGTEYFVLKASAIEMVDLPARFGDLPTLEMDKLPLCSDEVDLPEPQWIPEEPTVPDEYNKSYLRDQINLRSLAQAAYGTHVNLYMTARMYDIPFDFVAPEEDIVDLFQQKPYTDGLLYWEQDNQKMREIIATSGIALDFWSKKRCGLGRDKRVKTQPGTYTDLIDFHREQVDKFEVKAKKHINLIKQGMEARYAEVRVPRNPILLQRLQVAENRYRETNGLVDSRLSYNDFEMIGNYVMDRLTEMENNTNSSQTPDITREQFLEAYAWVWHNIKPSFRTNSVRSLYFNTDQKLMMGAMFDKLIEILS